MKFEAESGKKVFVKGGRTPTALDELSAQKTLLLYGLYDCKCSLVPVYRFDLAEPLDAIGGSVEPRLKALPYSYRLSIFSPNIN